MNFRTLVKRMPGARRLRARLKLREQGHSTASLDSLNQQLQVSLLALYREKFGNGQRPFKQICNTGFRCFSQFEEDGIIL